MSAEFSPICAHAKASEVVAWWRGEPIGRDLFLIHVEQLVRRLPKKRYAVNLCEDRYLFLLAFCAALVDGQTNLLPSSRLRGIVSDCVGDYPDQHTLADEWVAEIPLSAAPGRSGRSDGGVPVIAAQHAAAVVFTSGTTGKPKPHPQRWGDLVLRARITLDRLSIDPQSTIVATVPAQHMFGLETSILLPLVNGCSVDASQPFFPEDVRTALSSKPRPRVLVTTPTHLRALVASELQWPVVRFLLSATAPLSRSLAAQAEQCFQAPLFEIYGSTETGAMATRRPVESDWWQPCDGLSFVETDGRVCAAAPQLPEVFALQDRIELAVDGRFRLLGRQSDLVNVAGKRGSIADLTRKLMEVDGVLDAVLVADDEHHQPLPRLCALVVAPGLSGAQILRALSDRVDPVFLPRPLYTVRQLGRSETGKLPDSQVRDLIKKIRAKRGLDESALQAGL